ncbi:hypothetical protein ACLESD_16975 [Pyxidicoccus sp. 3LFB2]
MKYGVALAAALLLTGCAVVPPRFTVDVPKQRALKLNDVYVYSFLDFQAHLLGETFLQHFRGQLAAALTRHGVRNTQMLFRDALSSQRAPVLARDGLSLNVPVGVIVARNQLTEDVFGARYRLVIFPSELNFHMHPAGNVTITYFEDTILWRLLDATTGAVVWSATSRGSRNYPAGGDADSKQRAHLLVEAFIEQLRSQGLIEAMQAPALVAEHPGPGR